MFGKNYVTDLIERSAENPADRRRFVNSASAAALRLVRAGLPGPVAPAVASAQDNARAISGGAILNVALNLEYLEAELPSNAVHGHGLPGSVTRGKGRRGPVEGGRAVRFRSRNVRGFAREIARDEDGHVRFPRGALGSAAVARPAISIRQGFTAAATAAGLIKPGQTSHVTPAKTTSCGSFMAGVVAAGFPASSALTCELLGWQPAHPGLIDDPGQDHYSHNPSA